MESKDDNKELKEKIDKGMTKAGSVIQFIIGVTAIGFAIYYFC